MVNKSSKWSKEEESGFLCSMTLKTDEHDLKKAHQSINVLDFLNIYRREIDLSIRIHELIGNKWKSIVCIFIIKVMRSFGNETNVIHRYLSLFCIDSESLLPSAGAQETSPSDSSLSDNMPRKDHSRTVHFTSALSYWQRFPRLYLRNIPSVSLAYAFKSSSSI